MLKQLGNINMLMFGESLGRASFEFDGGRVTKKNSFDTKTSQTRLTFFSKHFSNNKLFVLYFF